MRSSLDEVVSQLNTWSSASIKPRLVFQSSTELFGLSLPVEVSSASRRELRFRAVGHGLGDSVVLVDVGEDTNFSWLSGDDLPPIRLFGDTGFLNRALEIKLRDGSRVFLSEFRGSSAD
jgi:hypothetical protein